MSSGVKDSKEISQNRSSSKISTSSSTSGNSSTTTDNCISLDDCLNAFTKTETLDDADKPVICQLSYPQERALWLSNCIFHFRCAQSARRGARPNFKLKYLNYPKFSFYVSFSVKHLTFDRAVYSHLNTSPCAFP